MKMVRCNVDCSFLIKVTHKNNVTLTSSNAAACRPASSDPPAAAVV